MEGILSETFSTLYSCLLQWCSKNMFMQGDVTVLPKSQLKT